MKKFAILSIIIILIVLVGIFIISNQKEENRNTIKTGKKTCINDNNCEWAGCGCLNSQYLKNAIKGPENLEICSFGPIPDYPDKPCVCASGECVANQKPTGENSKYCEVDEDCKIFSGCDCGCYNKNYEPPITNRECLCKSPIGCSCINNICTE